MNLLSAIIGKPFIPAWSELRPFIAETWLIVAIIGVLVAPFFTKRSNAAAALVALAGLVLGLFGLLLVRANAGVGQHFVGMLVADQVSYFWKVLLLVFVIGVILMYFSTTADQMHEGDGPEFFTLMLGATLGMCLMVSTTNLLMIVMAVEMASLPSYVLAGFRKTNKIGAEASLKYVLFGAATSSIMVYGLSILYGLYGTLQLPELATMMTQSTGHSPLLVVAIFGLIVGIGFKISAVPFHFWCPDVFEGAGIDVAAFLSVASKGAGLLLLLRIVMTIAAATGYQSTDTVTAIAVVIGVIGAISATVGNTAAFVQTNIKRLLAYSSIAHAGYMLCAVSMLFKSASAAKDFDPAAAAAQSLLLYLAVYLFMNLGAFTAAGLVYRQTGSEDLSAYSGLGRRSPLIAACLTACLFSLIGLPPLAGFVAKVNLLWVLIQDGGWWWWLVAVIGVNTIISLYYYVRVIRVMYLEDKGDSAFIGHPLGLAITAVCSIVLVLMLVGFSPLNSITTHYSRMHLGVTAAKAPQASVETKVDAKAPIVAERN